MSTQVISIKLRKIIHRGATRIGIFFAYHEPTIVKLKSQGATYSHTLKCWYVDYTPLCYKQLKESFSDIVIEKDQDTAEINHPVAGLESRDLPPIGAPLEGVPNSPVDTQLPNDKGHKADTIPLANLLKPLLYPSMGKYWVFAMNYHYLVSKELLKVKGVYWSHHQRVYYAFRHVWVKDRVEKLIDSPGFFPCDFWVKYQGAVVNELTFKTHTDRMWMQVYVPNDFLLTEKMKRF